MGNNEILNSLKVFRFCVFHVYARINFRGVTIPVFFSVFFNANSQLKRPSYFHHTLPLSSQYKITPFHYHHNTKSHLSIIITIQNHTFPLSSQYKITPFHYHHNTKSQLIFHHLTLLSIIGYHSFSAFHYETSPGVSQGYTNLTCYALGAYKSSHPSPSHIFGSPPPPSWKKLSPFNDLRDTLHLNPFGI